MRTEITPGQTSDYLGFDLVMADNLPEPSVLLADRGYDSDNVRKTMEARDVLSVIPMRKNRKLRVAVDRVLYRLRNLVERCFNKLKNARRAAAEARDHNAMTEANHRFHLAIGAACRNRFLSDAYEAVLNFNLRLTRLAFASSGPSAGESQAYYDRIYKEHNEMIGFLTARDCAPMAELSRRHVQLFHGKIADFVMSVDFMDAELVQYEIS